MDRLYHGCCYKNADGTNRLTARAEDCILQTSRCFWKDPSVVISGVKMWSHAKTEPWVKFRTVDKYYKDKEILTTDIM